MENAIQKQKELLEKSLIFGMIGGTILGVIFPCLGFLLFDQDGKIFRFIGKLLLTSFLLISFILQPVFQFEAEKAFFIYVLVSAIFVPLLGVGFGYLFFKWKNHQLQINNFAVSLEEKRKDHWRIFIVLTILVGTIILIAHNYAQILMSYHYRDLANQKRSEMENSLIHKKLEAKIIDLKEKREIVSPATNQLNNWHHHADNKFNFTFNLPPHWSAYENETQTNYISVKIENDNLSEDVRQNNYWWLTVVKKDVSPDGPGRYCAFDFDTLNDFCIEGCKILNDHTAIDYRIVNYGEPMATAQVFLDADEENLAVCLEMDIHEEIDKISQRDDISQEKAIEKYRKNLLDGGSEFSLELIESIQLFEQMAVSIVFLNN